MSWLCNGLAGMSHIANQLIWKNCKYDRNDFFSHKHGRWWFWCLAQLVPSSIEMLSYLFFFFHPEMCPTPGWKNCYLHVTYNAAISCQRHLLQTNKTDPYYSFLPMKAHINWKSQRQHKFFYMNCIIYLVINICRHNCKNLLSYSFILV